ncbi:MAG: hypothetical protein HRU14_01295 [Planctomycetes bacterium]|nr:hypothetical protein [Planctomycetota bacterium]
MNCSEIRVWTLILVGLVFGQPVNGQTQEERVRELEAKVARMADEMSSLKSELVSAKGRLEAAESKKDGDELGRLIEEKTEDLVLNSKAPRRSAIDLSGYFDLEFRDDNAGDKATEFDHHRLILKAHSDITQVIAFDMELEIEGGGVGAGHLTSSEIIVEFAELSFRMSELFNLKAGVLLAPFNRFNLLHDSPLQDLTDRPLVNRRIIPTTWAESGVGAFGATYWNWGSLDYDVIVANGLTDAMSTSGGTRSARGSYRQDNNDNKMVIGRLGLTLDVPFLDVLNLGGSIAHGKYDGDGDHSLTMVGFDWTLKQGPFELVGEYANLDINRGADEVMAGIPGGMGGWYVEGRFHFFPDSWRGTNAFFTDQSTFTLVVRYGEADTDDSGTAVDFAARGDGYRDDRRRLTLGFNFRPVESTVFKIEYQIFLEPSGIEDVDNNRFVVSFATYF